MIKPEEETPKKQQKIQPQRQQSPEPEKMESVIEINSDEGEEIHATNLNTDIKQKKRRTIGQRPK